MKKQSLLCETTQVMVTLMNIRTYSELSELTTFEERYRYLRLSGVVGESTFGFDRYLNQIFYKSDRWRSIRNEIIVRDKGCDLGIEEYEIGEHQKLYIHHMNPLTVKDIVMESEFLLNPEYLICTTHHTHNAIHYGDDTILLRGPIVRTKNDTCPWRR